MLCHRLVALLLVLACPARVFTQTPWHRGVKVSLNDLIHSCCFQGSHHGQSPLAATCKIQRDYQKEVRHLVGIVPTMSIPPSDIWNRTEVCQKSFETCCQNELDDYACNKGYNLALKRENCTNFWKSSSYGTAFAEKMVDCCSACNAGIETAKKTRKCTKNTFISQDYDSMFEKCCSDQINLISISAQRIDAQAISSTPSYSVWPAPGVNFASVEKEDPCRSRNKNRCHHNCHNQGYGIVRCSCREGYRVVGKWDCEDIDECSELIHKCPPASACANTPGSYACVPIFSPNRSQLRGSDSVESSSGFPYSLPIDDSTGRCPAGYKESPDNPRRCIDVNECEEMANEYTCDPRFRCQNTWGKFVCVPVYSPRQTPTFDKCAPGLKMEGGICLDINECAIGNHNCLLATENCVNTHGSFKCESLTDKAEYDSGNSVGHLPPNCPDGQVFNLSVGKCVQERLCRAGYYWDPDTRRCVDVNECEDDPCDVGSTCQNIAGSYRCDQVICQAGEVLDRHKCIRNPCNLYEVWNPYTSSCDESEHHVAVTPTRSFCPSGYKRNNEGDCEDVDECALNLHTCKADQNCINMEGHYRCTCKVGLTRSLTNDSCVDINECDLSAIYCGAKEECRNTHGSYECLCIPGYTKNVLGLCEDINECALMTHNCHQECTNTQGSFICSCTTGFVVDPNDSSKCVDLDECRVQPNKLFNRKSSQDKQPICQFQCENIYGSFNCKCPHGYLLDPDTNRTCIDIDECESDPCPDLDNSICLNTRGSFECIQVNCPVGYEHETLLRCKRRADELCRQDDPKGCVDIPLHYTFNYFTFPSNLKLSDGKIRIFEISGVENYTEATMDWEFDLRNVLADSPRAKVQKHWFEVTKDSKRMTFSSLRQIQGPQSFEVVVKAQILYRGDLVATNMVKSFIYVSKYEF